MHTHPIKLSTVGLEFQQMSPLLNEPNVGIESPVTNFLFANWILPETAKSTPSGGVLIPTVN